MSFRSTGRLWDDSQYYEGRKGKVMATVTDPVCGFWPRRSSTPSERAVLSSWFALPAQAGVGEEAALVFCQ
jgi:hypothetical protein